MAKDFKQISVTLQDLVNMAVLAAYSNNKDCKNYEKLTTLAIEELQTYYILVPLKKPYYDKDGTLVVEERIPFMYAMLSAQQRICFRNTIKRVIDFSIIPDNNPFIHNPNHNKFVKTALKLFPNIDAYQAGHVITSLRQFVQNIYFNMKLPGLKAQQKSLYLHSILGGTGKSEFMNRLKNFLTKYDINYGTTKPIGRWVGSEYSRQLVSLVDEWMPPKGQDKDITIARLNNIIDNTIYEVEYKGQDKLQVKSKSTLVFSSNFKPFDTNDRRYNVIQYNEIPYANISQEDREKYFPERTEEEWNQIFLDLFESCPFDKVWKDKEVQISDSLNEVIWMAKDVIAAESFSYCDINCCTIREFIKAYNALKDIKTTSREQTFIVKQAIRKAVALRKIKPTKMINGNPEYSKYNLEEIAALPTSEDDIENPLNDIENPFERTVVAFNAFLEEEKPVSPDDNKTKTLKNGNLFVERFKSKDGIDVFKKCETTNKGQQQVVVNLPLPHNDGTSRKNCDVEQNCFLLEIDAQKEDKEKFEQKNPGISFKGSKEEKESADNAILKYMRPFYNNYKDCLKWVCSSGRVSIHAVLKTNIPKNEINPGLRAYVFERLNETYFNNTLDGQCKNAGRLARNPNAVRDNGITQSALIINENCNEMDVSNWIKEYEELQKIIKPTVQYNTTKFNDTSIEALERMVNATKKESGILALALARGERVASGENLIGAISYMKTLADHNPEWTELYHRVWNEAHLQHPSNIGSPAK